MSRWFWAGGRFSAFRAESTFLGEQKAEKQRIIAFPATIFDFSRFYTFSALKNGQKAGVVWVWPFFHFPRRKRKNHVPGAFPIGTFAVFRCFHGFSTCRGHVNRRNSCKHGWSRNPHFRPQETGKAGFASRPKWKSMIFRGLFRAFCVLAIILIPLN